VIRQAISCDICASEKRQTNHWFVAYEQGGELRLSNWNSRHRRSPGAKHLCGQACLHKLVDGFVAKSIAVRKKPTAEADRMNAEPKLAADASLTSAAAHADWESSARLLTPPAPLPLSGVRPQPELLTMAPRSQPEDSAPVPEGSPRYASRNWRAEAWEQERERELRAVENRPDIAARRRNA
jgi:hypothetical protein